MPRFMHERCVGADADDFGAEGLKLVVYFRGIFEFSGADKREICRIKVELPIFLYSLIT